jgi:hypothetical protein
MKQFLKLLVLFVFVVSLGCKDSALSGKFKPKSGFSPVVWGESLDPEKEAKVRKAVGENYKKVENVIMSPRLLESWQKRASNLLKSRSEADSSKSYASFTHQLWVIDAVYVDVFGPPELTKGMWIKFNDNLTYEYGRYDKTSGTGKYHYNPMEELLLLVDNDPEVKPLEFQVGWEMAYIVIGGTDQFEDKDLMIKLIKKDTKPAKS